MSRRVRLFLFIVAGLAVFAVLAVAAMYWAAAYEPDFYAQALEMDADELAEQSDRMLRQTTALANAVQKKGRWRSLFTAQQLNGWLAVDLPKNHPKMLPVNLSAPRVAIDPKYVKLACLFEHGGFKTVLSITVEPSVPEPNTLALRIVKVRAGLLPLPLANVLSTISATANDMKWRLQWRRAGGDPVALITFSPDDDDKSVTIEKFQLGDGEIYVSGATGKPNP